MFKKTIHYKDYDGNERNEDFYFNLTKAEVMEMELGASGGFARMLEKIVSDQDGRRMVEIFKEFIVRSYGEKSPDGKRFIKNKELTDAFMQTEAFSELFMELATDPDAASVFINGVIPAAIVEAVVAEQAQPPIGIPWRITPEIKE